MAPRTLQPTLPGRTRRCARTALYLVPSGGVVSDERVMPAPGTCMPVTTALSMLSVKGGGLWLWVDFISRETAGYSCAREHSRRTHPHLGYSLVHHKLPRSLNSLTKLAHKLPRSLNSLIKLAHKLPRVVVAGGAFAAQRRTPPRVSSGPSADRGGVHAGGRRRDPGRRRCGDPRTQPARSRHWA